MNSETKWILDYTIIRQKLQLKQRETNTDTKWPPQKDKMVALFQTPKNALDKI